MKITWDNIDSFKLSKRGNFKFNKGSVTLRENNNCCKICGDPYFAYTGHIKKGRGLTCSSECGLIYKSNNHIPLEPNTNCYWCDKPIYRAKLKFKRHKIFFCDHNCHIKSQKVDHGCKPQYIQDDKYMEKCIYCGNKLNSLYCNNKCQNNYNYLIKVNKWKLGLINGVRGKSGILNFIRRYLFEKHNSSCQKCGWSVKNIYTNKIPLEIHHIDGDYTNNKENNLLLLCPNCHSLTDNFRSRGNNNKRTHR